MSWNNAALFRSPIAVVAAVCVASGSACTIAQAQTSVSLAHRYVVREVSAGGFANTISGGVIGGSVGNHGVLWTGQGLVDLNPANATFSAVYGRSGSLSVGYAGTASLAQWPVLWQGATPTTLPVPFSFVAGRAVATDGAQIVGSATEGNPERGAGATHAMLWDLNTGAAIDLGKDNTVNGVGGGVQVGTALGSNGSTAGMWRGTANSFVDLHVPAYDVSVATDTDGTLQVGYLGVDVRVRAEGRPRDIRFYSAGYWTGSAASFTYLPSTYRHSFALAIESDTIAGYGNTTDAIGTPKESHAIAWVGVNHEFVDLHALLPTTMRTSRAASVDESGNVVGWGVDTAGVVHSYVWLRQHLAPVAEAPMNQAADVE